MTEFSSLELFLLYNQSMEQSIAKFFDQPTFLRIKKTWEMFFVPVASGLGEKHWQSMPIDKLERLKLEANLNLELTRRREKRIEDKTKEGKVKVRLRKAFFKVIKTEAPLAPLATEGLPNDPTPSDCHSNHTCDDPSLVSSESPSLA